jgi:EAL domain-containing protein (putative c-di-GMP-specific phosphodiesterase class I)/amino acid transporter/GGDEF domain-containing protein
MRELLSEQEGRLTPYLSAPGAWAFSLGTAIGWGSLVVTGSSYLLQAGPVGSIVGLVLGAAVMLVIAHNYHYLINCFPDSGGAYTYAKEILGYDHGFLTAWFLALVYLAILWANATSLPLFARYFLGSTFQWGYCYSVFGYDVYLGEALLSICAVVIVAAICTRSRKGVSNAMVGMAVVLSLCIVACFVGGLTSPGGAPTAEPLTIPSKSIFAQIARIACISSWAFIGFENISHFADEYDFPRNHSFRIMAIAIASATVLYACVIGLSVMAYPGRYDNWLEYLRDVPNLNGLEGIPAFYAASQLMGDLGVNLLMTALLCLILTSLVGNMMALSRLFYALAKDDILPARFSKINQYGIPARAIALVAAATIPVPFLGRTAIGWIVDVTTLGATTVYGLVSFFAVRVGEARGKKMRQVWGSIGVGFMVGFGLYLLLPNLLHINNDLAPESFFIFALWGLIGFAVFRWLLGRDAGHRFGRSPIVWMFLLATVIFVALVWTDQSVMQVIDNTFETLLASVMNLPSQSQGFLNSIDRLHATARAAALTVTVLGTGILMLACILLLSSLTQFSSWAQESEEALDHTREVIYTDPLTGLSTLVHFQEQVAEQAKLLHDTGSHPVVLSFDLMGMGSFNNKHGRKEGDDLLCAFADELRVVFGEQWCCRGSEDSFFALVTYDHADEYIKQFFDRFARVHGGVVLPVRAGACLCEREEDVLTIGFDHARVARDRDRNTWASHLTWYSDDMDTEATSRMQVLDQLDHAIADRWIHPYYQAVVDTHTGKVCSEEALARWVDPQGTFLPPNRFIPVVEEAGLLYKIDLHMIDCVVQDMAHRRGLGEQVIPVSVNVSLDDLKELDVASELAHHMDIANLSHDLLHIEFTESVASTNAKMLHDAIESLHAAGFEVWMDDFGSGYSSLNSLKNFDFDVVKLDMEFIRGANTKKAWDIVAGVISTVHSIGARTLAEGVETEEQARILTEAGCDMLQGYLYARPAPLPEAIENIRRINLSQAA